MSKQFDREELDAKILQVFGGAYTGPVNVVKFARALKLTLALVDAHTAIEAHDKVDCRNWGDEHHALVLKRDAAYRACEEAGLCK